MPIYAAFPLSFNPLRMPQLFIRSWSRDFFEILGFYRKWMWCGSIHSGTICCAWWDMITIAQFLMAWSGLPFRYDLIHLNRIDPIWSSMGCRPDRIITIEVPHLGQCGMCTYVHIEPILSVVIGYDCGPGVFHNLNQECPPSELWLDPKAIYSPTDYPLRFKISYDWHQDLVWADMSDTLIPP